MGSVWWVKPLVPLAALLFAGGLAPRAAALLPVKRCIRSCKDQQRECVRQLRDRFDKLRGDCGGPEPRIVVKGCKKTLRQGFNGNKRECKKLGRTACKPCCRAESTYCTFAIAIGEAPGTVSSDTLGDGTALADPVEVEVVSPNPGSVSIAKKPIVESAAAPAFPPEFESLGLEFTISAPEATSTTPCVLTFLVHSTRVPANESALEVFRDGVPAARCVGFGSGATPDPCVSRREVRVSGDARITVLTSSTAGTWTIAERICGNGTLDLGEECDPPGGFGECEGCEPCSPGCGCGLPLSAPCEPNPAGGPNVFVTTIVRGADLDVGWTGAGHNQDVATGSQAFFACLKGCDTMTDPECTGIGPTGPGSINGEYAGPPAPTVAESIAVCLVMTFAEDIKLHSLDLSTGESNVRVRLTANAFLTGDRRRPCPTCSGTSVGAAGSCFGGPKSGQACVTDMTTSTFGNTSRDCPPFGLDFSGALDIEMDPITTGTATLLATTPCSGGLCPCKGQEMMNSCNDPFSCDSVHCPSTGVSNGTDPGEDQQCCPVRKLIDSCFFLDVSRTGVPVVAAPQWPEPSYPKIGRDGRIVSAFCVPRTNTVLINTPFGLPGPGAFEFVVDQCVGYSAARGSVRP